MGKILPFSFYERNTLQVSRDLLGKILVVKTGAGEVSGRIVETEAYRSDDPASHSARGRTPRTAVMFGKPGVAYVYFIYGNYEMLNFVTEPMGAAGAVLIRAVEPLTGFDLMAKRRAKPLGSIDLTNGPGKLCRAMGVEMIHNGESLKGPGLVVVDDAFVPESISVSPRVGITAGTDRLWRFFITGNPYVSRTPQNVQAKECA